MFGDCALHGDGEGEAVVRKLSHLDTAQTLRHTAHISSTQSIKCYKLRKTHRESVLAAALRLLAGDELVPVHGHRRLALPPVSRLLVKLLPQPGISNIFVCTFIISILDT